tara:strand:- start:1557 stop:2024 length:468 start_codon:yes stop_codon:yes gene_type:complete
MKNLKYFLLLLFLLSCGYSPIYQANQKSNFKLGVIEYSGDKEIGRSIIKNIERLKKNKTDNIYNVSLISSKKDVVATKDKKGNASSFKTTIIVDFYLDNASNNKNFKKKFIKETIYNSMDNKFELNQYKKNLEKNMISQILQDIRVFLTIIENDL